MKLLYLTILFIVIIFSINYKEGLTTRGVGEQNDYLNDRKIYYESRKFPSFVEGDVTSTNFLKLNDTNSNLLKSKSGKFRKKSDISKHVEKCEVINKTGLCDNISRTVCGYCHSRGKFMYGNEKGPLVDVCDGKWIKPGENSGYYCQKIRDQTKCAKVKDCGGSIGEASICAWCPSEQKAFAKKNNGKGGWQTKYKDDKCEWSGSIGGKPTSLIDVNQCEKFKQAFPCMGPNWKTGPHTQKCLNSLWDKAGCTGNLNERIPKSGLSLSSELKKWNSTAYASAAASMNQYKKNINSNNYETAKIYTKACLGNSIKPCQSKFTSRPNDCDIDMWKKSGCSKKGLLNPESNKKWTLNFPNRFEETKPSDNSQGALNKLYNDIMGYKSKADEWKRKANIDYTKAINYNQSCFGVSPPRPFKKLCWKDFSSKMSVIPGIKIKTNSINFSNAPNKFKSLMPNSVGPHLNERIAWSKNYELKESVYKSPFFPDWTFIKEYVDIKNTKWNSFKNTMLSWPGVKLINNDKLEFNEMTKFVRLMPYTTNLNVAKEHPYYIKSGSKYYLTLDTFKTRDFPYHIFLLMAK
jgi:hypothetical protein